MTIVHLSPNWEMCYLLHCLPLLSLLIPSCEKGEKFIWHVMKNLLQLNMRDWTCSGLVYSQWLKQDRGVILSHIPGINRSPELIRCPTMLGTQIPSLLLLSLPQVLSSSARLRMVHHHNHVPGKRVEKEKTSLFPLEFDLEATHISHAELAKT